MSDITLNTQSITGNHNFVPPGTDWNLGSGSKKWNGGYFGTIIADNGIPAGTAATGGDKIGQIRFSINPNIEPGYLALNGQEVNRTDYPNLWEWVQQQVGFLVEEGEWQSISTAHNGNVGKYSVGNGSTTFRLPNLGCWVRGGGTAGNASNVGKNLDAGLPNIEGTFSQSTNISSLYSSVGEFEGAFYANLRDVAKQYQSGYSGDSAGTYDLGFAASLPNAIYGNAETVQPESIVGIWLVKAYHVPVDNMGNTITVNGVPPDENGDITIGIPKPVTASEAEAKAGTNNTKFMTPLRVKQAIDVLADSGWTISKGTNGWMRESSTGFTIQWMCAESSGSVTFPRTFTTVYGAVAVSKNRGDTTLGVGAAMVTALSTTKATVCQAKMNNEQYNRVNTENLNGYVLAYGIS